MTSKRSGILLILCIPNDDWILKRLESVNEHLDFPIEWADALVWGLAARIGFEYQAPLQKMQMIKQNADQFLDDMLGWDEETVSLNIQPSPTRA
jgi:hypothetical protein